MESAAGQKKAWSFRLKNSQSLSSPGIHQQIVVATGNAGKICEIEEILKDVPWKITPVTQLVTDFSVVEDGQSYTENAVKKAKEAARLTGSLVIADDSGLEVDALGGAPGIYSARFGGEQLPFSEKIALLLRKLEGVSERSARFRCVIAVVSPDGATATAEGTCEGLISTQARGQLGFGFDPVFFVPGYQKTMAELEPAVKNTISHRAKALSHLPALLQPFLVEHF
jgi:XTP/dITP diphosphohydrolase